MLNARKSTRGDQIVQVVLQGPEVQDERTKELLREMAKPIRRIRAKRCGKENVDA